MLVECKSECKSADFFFTSVWVWLCLLSPERNAIMNRYCSTSVCHNELKHWLESREKVLAFVPRVIRLRFTGVSQEHVSFLQPGWNLSTSSQSTLSKASKQSVPDWYKSHGVHVLEAVIPQPRRWFGTAPGLLGLLDGLTALFQESFIFDSFILSNQALNWKALFSVLDEAQRSWLVQTL